MFRPKDMRPVPNPLSPEPCLVRALLYRSGSGQDTEAITAVEQKTSVNQWSLDVSQLGH